MSSNPLSPRLPGFISSSSPNPSVRVVGSSVVASATCHRNGNTASISSQVLPPKRPHSPSALSTPRLVKHRRMESFVTEVEDAHDGQVLPSQAQVTTRLALLHDVFNIFLPFESDYTVFRGLDAMEGTKGVCFECSLPSTKTCIENHRYICQQCAKIIFIRAYGDTKSHPLIVAASKALGIHYSQLSSLFPCTTKSTQKLHGFAQPYFVRADLQNFVNSVNVARRVCANDQLWSQERLLLLKDTLQVLVTTLHENVTRYMDIRDKRKIESTLVTEEELMTRSGDLTARLLREGITKEVIEAIKHYPQFKGQRPLTDLAYKRMRPELGKAIKRAEEMLRRKNEARASNRNCHVRSFVVHIEPIVRTLVLKNMWANYLSFLPSELVGYTASFINPKLLQTLHRILHEYTLAPSFDLHAELMAIVVPFVIACLQTFRTELLQLTPSQWLRSVEFSDMSRVPTAVPALYPSFEEFSLAINVATSYPGSPLLFGRDQLGHHGTRLQADYLAHHVMKTLVILLLKLDPSSTTSEAMDRLGLRFVCVDCDSIASKRPELTWREIVNNFSLPYHTLIHTGISRSAIAYEITAHWTMQVNGVFSQALKHASSRVILLSLSSKS
ncbi:hypothetical protein OF83DRAFT_88262 [Amylostereum chailletii]|nr:hypothetical protein OF83DRAFT_88262 [Amylostereum chailletii]